MEDKICTGRLKARIRGTGMSWQIIAVTGNNLFGRAKGLEERQYLSL